MKPGIGSSTSFMKGLFKFKILASKSDIADSPPDCLVEFLILQYNRK